MIFSLLIFSEGESYGTLHFYDKSVDKISVKTQVPLVKSGGEFAAVRTTDDPVIARVGFIN